MATSLVLSPYRLDDLADIVALRNRLVPAHARWSVDDARGQLMDIGRGHGAHVVVARRHGAIAGVAGWVELGAAAGEFYGAPLVAADDAVAEILIEHLLARAGACGAAWLRISGWPEEAAKLRVLPRSGFVHRFDFVSLELVLHASPLAPPALPERLHPVARDDIDHARFAELYNVCFRDVPNTPVVDAELSRESWHDELVWPEASLLLADRDGRYQAFVIMRRHGAVDVVGVAPAWREQGLALAMMRRVIHGMFERDVRRLTSLCASTNAASLALHGALGFTEAARSQVWQRDLDPSGI